MPTRDAAPVGAPCWIDLLTSDRERSQAFYGTLFGWTAQDLGEEFGGYVDFTQGEIPDVRVVAGCVANEPGSGLPDTWAIYLATDDVTKTIETAIANAGRVHIPAIGIGDRGTMAFLVDPGGATIGIWQPDKHPGFGILGESGTPSWFELHTRDYQATVDFYRTVSGLDTHVLSDTPEFRYTILKHGEDWLAGIMDASDILSDGVPAHWSVYFGVDDTDAALARIVDLGGSIVMAAKDTPYGRLAAAADPTGVRFKLVAPSAAMPAPDTAP